MLNAQCSFIWNFISFREFCRLTKNKKLKIDCSNHRFAANDAHAKCPKIHVSVPISFFRINDNEYHPFFYNDCGNHTLISIDCSNRCSFQINCRNSFSLLLIAVIAPFIFYGSAVITFLIAVIAHIFHIFHWLP